MNDSILMKRQNLVRQYLADSLQKNKVLPEELFVIFSAIENSENVDDLFAKLKILVGAFPVLESILRQFGLMAKSEFEQEVAVLIGKLTKVDPNKAVEVSRMALQKDMTMSKILEKFPEIK